MITITEAAAKKIKELLEAKKTKHEGLRIKVVGGGCSGLSYELEFDNRAAGDQIFERSGTNVIIDPKSYLYLAGSTVNYVDGLQDAGFKITNPNAKGGCGCGSSFNA